MTATLVDPDVLIDVLSGDSAWTDWSSQALGEFGSEGTLAIDAVIYAEVSHRYTSKELLDRELPR